MDTDTDLHVESGRALICAPIYSRIRGLRQPGVLVAPLHVSHPVGSCFCDVATVWDLSNCFDECTIIIINSADGQSYTKINHPFPLKLLYQKYHLSPCEPHTNKALECVCAAGVCFGLYVCPAHHTERTHHIWPTTTTCPRHLLILSSCPLTPSWKYGFPQIPAPFTEAKLITRPVHRSQSGTVSAAHFRGICHTSAGVTTSS